VFGTSQYFYDNRIGGLAMQHNMDTTLEQLIDKGVVIMDPRQTYIDENVDPSRIFKGAVLFPGTRLGGKRTLIGSAAKIGTEGPATIQNTIVGSHAEVASGFMSDATLLPRAKAGANAHFRAGTLLEEEASTAHCVGLKQSILMYGVTLGSLINFCEVLISGGRSRKEHTEVGSGFIHFNYTPWGKYGDKATPSLVGTVTEGVFLNQDRIFLGGLSGMVGPLSVGFGALTVAGQVVRNSVSDQTMHAETGLSIDKMWSPTKVQFSKDHLSKIQQKNIEFLAQLYALQEWYTQIRLKRSILQEDQELTLIITGAIETIQNGIQERISRYNSFAKEWNMPLLSAYDGSFDQIDADAILTSHLQKGYDEWIWMLTSKQQDLLHTWLLQVASTIRDR
jgi:UDP-N-acetylglucosamine/UDP-N-acetylgalactosamine diphosphorylase